MRDRLIELIGKVQCRNSECAKSCSDCSSVALFDEDVEILADYLLENGVIVPPCKVGQTIYRIIIDKTLEFKIAKIEVFEDEIIFIDDVGKWFDLSAIGKTVFLTKEEAEQALKGGEQE